MISHSPRNRNKARCHRYDRHEGNSLPNGLIGLRIAMPRQDTVLPGDYIGHDASKTTRWIYLPNKYIPTQYACTYDRYAESLGAFDRRID